MMQRRTTTTITRGGLLTLALACALPGFANAAESGNPGDIPDTQPFFVYRGPGYRIEVPEGWSRRATPHGVRFSLRANSVELESLAGRPPAGGTPVRLAHATALRFTHRESSAPDPVTGKLAQLDVVRYVFSRNGRAVALTLRGPVGADNADVWKRIADSFTWA
jgi:hypothetical protein